MAVIKQLLLQSFPTQVPMMLCRSHVTISWCHVTSSCNIVWSTVEDPVSLTPLWLGMTVRRDHWYQSTSWNPMHCLVNLWLRSPYPLPAVSPFQAAVVGHCVCVHICVCVCVCVVEFVWVEFVCEKCLKYCALNDLYRNIAVLIVSLICIMYCGFCLTYKHETWMSYTVWLWKYFQIWSHLWTDLCDF